jgi:hypothetical protein
MFEIDALRARGTGRFDRPLSAALVAAVLCAGACAKSGTTEPTTSTRAQETSGAITKTEALKATVEAVDADKRVVMLRDEHGEPFTLDVGENVDLSKLRAKDSVRVVYQESVAFALANEQETAVPESALVEQSTQRIPEGVQFGRKVSATVEVVSVTEDGSHATFRVPDGAMRTVYVDDPPSQQKIANLRPGDAVAVTYTEKLAVALDPAFDD